MKQRHPYDNFTVFSVFLALAFGSTNAMQAVMAAGENTGEMMISGTIAATNFGMLLFVGRTLDKKQRQQEVARA